MGTFLLVLVAVISFGFSQAIRAGSFNQVIDIYLSNQCGDTLLGIAQERANYFEELQLLGTTTEDKSYHDRIRIFEYGIPLDLKIELSTSKQQYFYFLNHKSVSEVYADFHTHKNLILNFQKLVAGPGHYVKTDGASGRWLRHAFPSITGIFMTPIDGPISGDFIRKYGIPLIVTLKAGIPIMKLQEDLVVIPGNKSETAIYASIRELNEMEKQRWTAPIPIITASSSESHKTAR